MKAWAAASFLCVATAALPAEEIILSNGEHIVDVMLLPERENEPPGTIRYMDRYGTVHNLAMVRIRKLRVDVRRTWNRPDPYRPTRWKLARTQNTLRQPAGRIWRLQPFERALLAPGWGHWSVGERRKAIAIGGTTLALTYIFYNNYVDLQRMERRAASPEVALIGWAAAPGNPAANFLASRYLVESYNTRGDMYARRGNQASLLLGLLYGWQAWNIRGRQPVFMRTATVGPARIGSGQLLCVSWSLDL